MADEGAGAGGADAVGVGDVTLTPKPRRRRRRGRSRGDSAVTASSIGDASIASTLDGSVAGAGAGAGAGADAAEAPSASPPVPETVFQDRALPFVTLKAPDSDEFVVGEEAARVLESIKGRIMIVGVVGKMRTGKSFILNRLCGRANGFKVGPTTTHCTEGIWIWGRPIPIEKDGERINVVLLDSEGMGRPGVAPEHDARVFSLATLLSSLLVYNCLSEIDNSAIEYLALIVNFARRIHGQATGDEPGGDLMTEFQPSFLWLIRDFSLRSVDEDGNTLSARQYMEAQLSARTSRSREARQQNKNRQFINSFFPRHRRTCTFMVRPIIDESKLARAEDADWETDVVPKFKEQLEHLKDQIFHKFATVKQVHGRDVNGRMFANLARVYAAAINKGAVPPIDDVWQGIVKKECKVARKSALKRYRTTMAALARRLPVEASELDTVHSQARTDALRAFGEVALGGDASGVKAQLKAQIRDEAVKVSRDNSKASKRACRRLLESLKDTVLRPKYDDEEFFDRRQNLKEALTAVAEQYHERAVGPEKDLCWGNFLMVEMVYLMKRLNALRITHVAKVEEELAEINEKLAASEGSDKTKSRQISRMTEELTRTRAAMADAEQERQDMKARYDRAVEESAGMRGQLTVAEQEAKRQHERILQLQAALDAVPPPKSGCCSVM